MSIHYFNSIKVQLELFGVLEYVETPQFQFHKGTIRTSGSQASYYSQMAFQFHKGTIRTMRFSNLPLDYFTFQFHKGTIRTHCIPLE